MTVRELSFFDKLLHFLLGSVIAFATMCIGDAININRLFDNPAAAQPAQTTPIPAEAVCQDPYYLVSSGPDQPTVCALKEGYTDCHNFTAVPNGQTCDPATAPKPYVEPVEPAPAPAKKCEE